MNTVQKQLMSAAKAKLINHYGITENDAHIFIIHTAMENRVSKLAICQRIMEELR